VACGAGPAAAIGACVKLAQDRGWTVQVIATPAALEFSGAAAVSDQTGSPVRSQYARPGAPRSLIPDAVLVAPATYNTINKWAQGISDTYALGVLAEATGLGVPTVALPFVDTALAGRAPFRRSVESLRAEGVTISSAPAASSPTRPAPAATWPPPSPGTSASMKPNGC
jgi:phosphopantothenoylcysteine synthetase/decarboxylase